VSRIITKLLTGNQKSPQPMKLKKTEPLKKWPQQKEHLNKRRSKRRLLLRVLDPKLPPPQRHPPEGRTGLQRKLSLLKTAKTERPNTLLLLMEKKGRRKRKKARREKPPPKKTGNPRRKAKKKERRTARRRSPKRKN